MENKANKTLPKIHLCCSTDDYRAIFGYVLVTKEHVVASNSHILIAYETSSIFSNEFIEQMPDRFLIHCKSWELMAKKHIHIYYKEGYINVRYDNHSIQIKPIYELEFDKYPEWRAVILNSENIMPVDKIGIKPEFLYLLSKAMFKQNDVANFKLEFHDKHKSIMVYPTTDINAFGLIMPVMLTN